MIPGPPRHPSRLDLIGDTIDDGMDPDPRDARWMYQRLVDVEDKAGLYAGSQGTSESDAILRAVAIQLREILNKEADDE